MGEMDDLSYWWALIQIFRQNARKGFSGTIDFKIFQGHVPDPMRTSRLWRLPIYKLQGGKGAPNSQLASFGEHGPARHEEGPGGVLIFFVAQTALTYDSTISIEKGCYLIGYCYWLRLKMRGYSPYVNKGFVYISVSKILNFIRQLFIFSWF
jgi:hypothetical protein